MTDGVAIRCTDCENWLEEFEVTTTDSNPDGVMWIATDRLDNRDVCEVSEDGYHHPAYPY